MRGGVGRPRIKSGAGSRIKSGAGLSQDRSASLFLGGRTRIFGLGHAGVVGGGGGGAGAVPCGFAARAGRGLLRQEFGEVERGLGGGNAHRSVLSGHSDRGCGTRGRSAAAPRTPNGPSRPPCSEGCRGYAPFVGGKIGGVAKGQQLWRDACRKTQVLVASSLGELRQENPERRKWQVKA